jgi:transposase
MDARDLLPKRDYEVERVHPDDDGAKLQLSIRPVAEAVACPCCQTTTRRVHSHYERQVQDVAWGGRQVAITLKVRRFFCDNARCPRRIFVERLPGLAAPHARRTERLVRFMQQLGLVSGGTVGVEILRQLPVRTSRWTVVRDVRKVAESADYTPRVLGVDDWAIRRGHRYGTILVDLEAAQDIDLLPDREAETLFKWLQAHPGIQVITRDRAGAYAQAARRGAPNAVQVADRWHLFKNLGEALTNLLGRHRRALRQVKPLTSREADQSTTVSPQSIAYQKRKRRFDQVRQLREDGLTISAIANRMDLDRKTIRTYLNAERCPDGQRNGPRRRVSKLAPYQDYLCQHGLAGQHTIRQLWRDIQAQGFTGSLSTVATFIAAVRYSPPALTNGPLRPLPPKVPKADRLTPRRATWLLLSRPEDLTDEQRQQAQQIAQLHPEITHMAAEAQAFAAILRQRTVEVFDAWLQRTRLSTIRELRIFARGIQRDYAAVKAALELPYSNGMVEGSVNRLKFVKRSMFGRAKFDLLRLRVLALSQSSHHQICT